MSDGLSSGLESRSTSEMVLSSGDLDALRVAKFFEFEGQQPTVMNSVPVSVPNLAAPADRVLLETRDRSLLVDVSGDDSAAMNHDLDILSTAAIDLLFAA